MKCTSNETRWDRAKARLIMGWQWLDRNLAGDRQRSAQSERQLRIHGTSIMTKTTRVLVATATVALGCAGSYPAPTQHLADAQSAERSAAELGAASQPRAQLHLQLAREQIGMANASIRDGDNEKADRMLVRAKSDAELAIALTREEGAKAGAQGASVQSNNQRSVNANQGVQP